MSLRPGSPLGVGPLGAEQPCLSLARQRNPTASWSRWRRFAAPMPRMSNRFTSAFGAFRPLSPAEKEALEAEGESLLAFLVGETEDGSAHLNEVMVEW